MKLSKPKKCSAKQIANAKRWQAANPERAAANGKKWRAKHPTYAAESGRKWREEHPTYDRDKYYERTGRAYDPDKKARLQRERDEKAAAKKARPKTWVLRMRADKS